MLDDFERFPEGMPTYHEYITRIVADYAADVANATALSLKDLENFFRGVRSHVPRIKVLDAYIQIVRPSIRPSFFLDRYTDHVGSTFAEYLEVPEARPARRERVTSLEGAYRYIGEAGDSETSRFVVLKPNASGAFVTVHEFTATLDRFSQTPPGLRLFTGIMIPNEEAALVIMRDHIFGERRLGTASYSFHAAELPMEISYVATGVYAGPIPPGFSRSSRTELKETSIMKITNEATNSILHNIVDRIDRI